MAGKGRNDNKNRLLYDPNQIKAKRLGAFSMEEDNEQDEEIEEETTNPIEDENIQETSNQDEQSSESVPEDAPQPKRKSAVGSAVKNGAKSLGKKIGKKVLMFIASNPWCWLVIGGILIFVLILLYFAGDSSSDRPKFGLAGYNYFQVENLCETVKVYNPKSDTYTEELDFETEYIPGVVSAEVGGFSDAPEVLKLFAIAARSYALARFDSTCTIEGSASVQAFEFDKSRLNAAISSDSPIRQAADATYGLVAVKENKLLSTTYDAACYLGEDDENYHIGYGSSSLNGVWRDDPEIQYIPKSWAETKSGLMAYINGSKSNNVLCYQGHGSGASQYGAYYLATEKNYDFGNLLSFYYGDDVQIYSIYEGVSTNYTLATSAGTSDILTTSLKEFLNSKGTSVEAYNEYILSNILSVGFGTRDAAVVTAVSLVGTLYQNYGVRLPYTLCGQHYCTNMYSNEVNVNRSGTSFYGVDPNWGSIISNRSDGLYHYYYEGHDATYNRYGPDCSGFISWVLHNAGFNATVLGANAQGNLGTKHLLNGTVAGQPGDLIWHDGHIMMIVGVDEAQKIYYIVHASGGSQGVKINTVPFKWAKNYAVDMSDWYDDNRLEISDAEFVKKFRDGYVEKYTGAYDDLKVGVNNDVYFVGDSRTVGLCYANLICESLTSCKTNMCLAETGVGNLWFNENIKTIKKTEKKNIVINMGVNDLAGATDGEAIAKNYFDVFKSLANSLSKKNIYIMSVNPVGGGTSVSTSVLQSFNSEMNSLISESGIKNLKYLNTYSNVAFNYTDGLHYDNITYRSLYKYVLGAI